MSDSDLARAENGLGPRDIFDEMFALLEPERILREIRRRTRVVGAFPDGQSALNLAAARLTHIAGSGWSTKRYYRWTC